MPRTYLWLILTLLSAFSQGGYADDRGTDPTATSPHVRYDVSIDVPNETFLVNAWLDGIPGDTIVYHFPIWSPGAYDVAHFGAWVHDVDVRDRQGTKLLVLRPDTSTLLIVGGSGSCHLSYKVRDIERVENSAWFALTDIEPNYAFANTICILGYPVGYKDIPHSVQYLVPDGWDLSVGLDPLDSARHIFTATDYDELVDAPVHMGAFQRVEFVVAGRPHILSITAPQALTPEQVADVRSVADSIVRTISGFFGDMPYRRYMFQIFLVGFSTTDYSFGALEHRNSSTYRMPFNTSRGVGAGLAAVLAHEYWHLWSPKRIHVHQLGPFDYQNAPRTKSLWFAEGITEYYAQVLLARAALPGGRRGVRELLDNVFASTYGKQQGRSIADLSFNASDVGMHEFIALYSKGPVVALLLDAAIRTRSGHRTSLDDVMRFFNEHYGKTGKTFSDDSIIVIMEEASGVSLDDFYTRYIAGTEGLPFNEFLPAIGIRISTSERKQEMMGVRVHEVGDSGGGLRVAEVTRGGSADSSGVRVGDTIVGVTMRERTRDREYPTSSFPADIFEYALSPRTKSITVMRDGRRVELPVTRVPISVMRYDLVDDPLASDGAVAARRSIFGQ